MYRLTCISLHTHVSRQAEHAEEGHHHTSGAAGGAVQRSSVCSTSLKNGNDVIFARNVFLSGCCLQTDSELVLSSTRVVS